MNKQNPTETVKPTSRQKITNGLVVASILLLFILGKFWIKDKCSIIDCEPASWSKVQEIVIDNSRSWGTEYHLDHIDAFPKINEMGDVEDFRLIVYYVSTKQTEAPTGLVNPVRYILFDNKNLWIESRTSKSMSFISLPPSENLERFKRIIIEPNEAIDLTWDLANKALGQKATEALLKLDIDGEEFGIESNWEIVYFGNSKEQRHFWVDAQSGKIIQAK